MQVRVTFFIQSLSFWTEARSVIARAEYAPISARKIGGDSMEFARSLIGVVLSLILIAGIFAAGAFAPKEQNQSYVVEVATYSGTCSVD